MTDLFVAAGGAIVVGAAGSGHCLLMCGPLACAGCGEAPRLGPAIAYHLARLAGYALLGAAFGALGGAAGRALSLPIQRVLPWAMALALLLPLVERTGWLSRVPAPNFLTQILRRARALRERLPPSWRGGLYGALTPLLPCGLLYGFAGSLLVSGGVGAGAFLALAFGLGAIPALFSAQLAARLAANAAARRGALVPLGRRSARASVLWRALPLLAAGVLVYRAVLTSTGHSCH